MKLLLADDHPLVREGMKYVLQRLSDTPQLLEAKDLPGALRLLAQHRDFDLILTDLAMPGMPGPGGISQMRACAPSTPIVVLSALENSQDVRAALACGANGYIPKSSSNEVMLSAIQLVLAGGVYLPPNLLDNAVPDSKAPAAPGAGPALTGRQRTVLRLMAEGMTNKAIGRALHISEATVKAHITSILGILAASNRTEAVRQALAHGLLDGLNTPQRP